MIKKEAVERMIDNTISKSLKEGQSAIDIIEDLQKRSKNIFRIIDKENLDLSSLFGVLMGDTSIEDETIPKRVKYAYFYVNHCNKRIADMKWVVKKRTNLFIQSRNYTDKNVFDLITLKERLSENNALPF